MKDPFYANLKEVASDEVEHETFLTSALKGKPSYQNAIPKEILTSISAAGASPVARCTYNFPSTDVNSFLALASVLEGKQHIHFSMSLF